ncbi:PET191 family protein [Abortiporus biennis]
MSNTCEPLLAALKQCLLQSDCVVKDGNLPSDCLRNHTDELPESCQNLRKATFECKRGLLDMLRLKSQLPNELMINPIILGALALRRHRLPTISITTDELFI